MAQKLTVLDPTIEAKIENSILSDRPESLDGLTVGLLANGKRNSEELLQYVYEVIKEEYKLNKPIYANKGNASKPCPTDLLEDLADRCDFIITSSGDWGSCSSCSVHDGITFEKQGLPTAVICTEPFVTSGVAMAKMGGIPDYSFVVTDHPLGSLTQDDLKKRAREIAPEIISLLLN